MSAIVYVLLFIIGVAADALTKIAAAANLTGGKTVEFIPKVMSFVYVENNGAAFSSFQGMVWLLVALTLIALALIAYILFKGIVKSAFGKLSIVFVATGAVGNLIDRLLRGYVIDMIKLDFVNFPIFNIADVFVTVGTLMLVIYVLFLQKYEIDKKEETPAAAGDDNAELSAEQDVPNEDNLTDDSGADGGKLDDGENAHHGK